MSDDRDLTEKAAAKASDLYVDTQAERELSFSQQVSRMAATFGNTDNYLVGTLLNLATVAIGLAVHFVTAGWLSAAGAVFAILGVLGLLSGVLRL